MTEYTAESIILAITPKIPAFLSMIGSSYICYNVLTHREKRKRRYNRLMFGMSICDILASHVYFLGTWLIPRGSTGPYGAVFMAAGNNATCNYSGFFNQFAVASPLYNIMLSTFYLLKVRYNVSNIVLKRLEPYMHGFPILFALGTAITALVKDLYGNVLWTCWISPDFKYYQWFFLFAPVWLCIIYQSIVMTMLWWTIRQQEQKIATKYQVSAVVSNQTSIQSKKEIKNDNSSIINERKTKRSKMIATQGILYVCAFYITWLFPTIQRITELCCSKNFFPMQVLDTTLLPLQGLLNVLIYLRPKYMFYRRKHPDIPFWKIFQIVSDPRQETKIISRYKMLHAAAGRSGSRLSVSGAGDNSITNDEELDGDDDAQAQTLHIEDDSHIPTENNDAYRSFEDLKLPKVMEEYPDLDFIDYRKIIIQQWIWSSDNPANHDKEYYC